jgi:peptide/nickel transport system permease protein
MAIYILKRVGYALITLLFVSFVIFFLIHLTPGDPARVLLGVRATPETLAALRHKLGLDRSLLAQYGIFLGHLVHGDLGTSVRYGTSALGLIAGRLLPTLFLIGYSTVIAVVVALPLGVIAALRREKPADHAIRVGVLVAVAIPAFWIGTILIIVFSLKLGVLPASGYGEGFAGHVRSLFLPAVTLSLWQAGLLIRNIRGAAIDTLNLPHVDFAHLRGLPSRIVLRRHVLRASLTSTVTLIGVNLSFLLAGAVVVESVFTIPGSGSLLVDAVFSRDYPIVQGVTLLYAVMVIAINLATDLIYPILDPRVRLT